MRRIVHTNDLMNIHEVDAVMLLWSFVVDWAMLAKENW